MIKRQPIRRATRKLHCSILRRGTRMLMGARRPNHLLRALTAFTRAIRAHRRLARLAPRLFDSAVIDREAAARRDELERRRQWEPILNKVYGLPPDTPLSEPDEDWNSPVPRCRRTLLAMERELAAWELWMSIGRENMALFKQRQPHALISFTHLARLLDIGFAFARLATGLETTQPQPEPPLQNHLSLDESLHKIYGQDDSPAF